MTRVIYYQLIQKYETSKLKKIVVQIILLLIAATLLSSSSLLRVSAIETTNTPTANVNSASGLRIDTFDSNGINNSKSLSLDDIYAMPKTTVYSDLSCYGTLIESGDWGGVSLKDLLAAAGYTEPRANLRFYASDGYTTTLTVSDGTSQDIIVAYELDGSLLPENLRLVIPNANGESWISMITSIWINSPIYAIAPNPDAAQIIINQSRLQQSTQRNHLQHQNQRFSKPLNQLFHCQLINQPSTKTP